MLLYIAATTRVRIFSKYVVIFIVVQYGRYLENWYLEADRDLEASDFWKGNFLGLKESGFRDQSGFRDRGCLHGGCSLNPDYAVVFQEYQEGFKCKFRFKIGLQQASLEFILIVFWVHLEWGNNARGVGGGSKHIFEKKSDIKNSQGFVLAVNEKSDTPQCGKTEENANGI